MTNDYYQDKMNEAKEEQYKNVAYAAYRMVVDGYDFSDQLMLDLESLGLINEYQEWIYDDEGE